MSRYLRVAFVVCAAIPCAAGWVGPSRAAEGAGFFIGAGPTFVRAGTSQDLASDHDHGFTMAGGLILPYRRSTQLLVSLEYSRLPFESGREATHIGGRDSLLIREGSSASLLLGQVGIRLQYPQPRLTPYFDMQIGLGYASETISRAFYASDQTGDIKGLERSFALGTGALISASSQLAVFVDLHWATTGGPSRISGWTVPLRAGVSWHRP